MILKIDFYLLSPRAQMDLPGFRKIIDLVSFPLVQSPGG